MSSDRIRLGIVAESPQDAVSVTHLVNRVLIEHHDWLDGTLNDVLCWQGLEATETYFDIHHTSRVLRERGIKIHGQFSGEKGAPDARQFRGLRILFKNYAQHPVLALIIARDLDGKPERKHGFQQAADVVRCSFPVVGALADPEIEAWFCAGFQPQSGLESARLDDARQQLGFLPTEQPERLSAGRDQHKRNAKRILALLVDNDPHRRAACLDVPLALLEANGSGCGLAAFLKDIKEDVVPLLG